MSRIRENSKVILWLLLIFFLLSMTIGGLVGGANIIDRIFGRNQINQYVGIIDGKRITHQEYLREVNLQLQNQRRQNPNLDSRGVQNARNAAWNTIVDKTIQDKKIAELNLQTLDDEVYSFLLYSPPPQLQQQLTDAGYFADSTGVFQLEQYQTALKTGNYPNTLEDFWIIWEDYLKGWLPVRKLQNLYNQTASVSDYEVRIDFMKKNIKCSLEYIYVPLNEVADSLIQVSDEEISARYEKDKDRLYKTDPSRIVEYVIWPTNLTEIDSTFHSSYLDSINAVALRFAGEADFSSFEEAMKTYSITSDTIDVIQDFKNNSGIPFEMGVMRDAVRFSFDNPIGSVSDPFDAENGLAVFHIIGEKPEGYRPLSEVEDNIRRSLIRENKKEYARKILTDAFTEGGDFQTIAENNELIVFDSDSAKALGSTFKGIGRSNELSGILRAMEPGDISDPVATFSAVAIVKMLEKDEFDEEKFTEEYDTIRERLLNQKRNSIYSTWLSEYKKQIDIEDYRSLAY